MEKRLRPNQLIFDRFLVGEKISSGSEGTVYSGTDEREGDFVALKHIDITHPTMRVRVERFARYVNSLENKHLVEHRCVLIQDDEAVIVMQRVRGRDLWEVIRDPHLRRSDLTRLLRKLVCAVGEIHAAGLVHRDLKPWNVLVVVGTDGDLAPVIVDFGLVRAVDDDSPSVTIGAVGTPSWSSPEQLNDGAVECANDLWALGVILYASYTGRQPLPPRPADASGAAPCEPFVRPGTLCPSLPVAIDAVICDLLSADPTARPDCAQVAGRLLPYVWPRTWGEEAAPSAAAPSVVARALKESAPAVPLEEGAVASAQEAPAPKRARVAPVREGVAGVAAAQEAEPPVQRVEKEHGELTSAPPPVGKAPDAAGHLGGAAAVFEKEARNSTPPARTGAFGRATGWAAVAVLAVVIAIAAWKYVGDARDLGKEKHAAQRATEPRSAEPSSTGAPQLAPVPAASSSAHAPATRDVEFGYHSFSSCVAPVLAGAARFKARNIKVNLTKLDPGREAHIRWLRTNERGISTGELSYLLEFWEELRKEEYQILLLSSVATHSLVVQPGKSLSSFAGQGITVGYVTHTTGETKIWKYLANSMGRERTAKFLNDFTTNNPTGTIDASRKFCEGEISAALLWPYDTRRAVDSGGCVLISEPVPVFMIARREFIENSPDTVLDFLRGYLDSVKDIQQKPALAEEAIHEHFGWTLGQVGAALAGARFGAFADMRELLGLDTTSYSNAFDALFYNTVREIRIKDPQFHSPVRNPRELVATSILAKLHKERGQERLEDLQLLYKLVGTNRRERDTYAFQFGLGQNDLSLSDQKTLKTLWDLVAYLHEMGDAKVELIGSADPSHEPGADDARGRARAEHVKGLLMKQGIDERRIKVVSAGSVDRDAFPSKRAQRAVVATLSRWSKEPPSEESCPR